MLKLKKSGYNYKFRKEILDSGLKAHAKMIEDDKNNVKPMYRSRDWNLEAGVQKVGTAGAGQTTFGWTK